MVRWTWAIFHAQVLLSCNSSRFLFNKKTPGFTSLALGLAPEFEGYATVHWLCVATCYSALGAAPAATLSLRPAQAACVARSRIGASESQGKATTFGGGLWASHQLLGILQNFSFLEVRHTCLEGVAFVCFCCILSFLVAKNDPPPKKNQSKKKKEKSNSFHHHPECFQTAIGLFSSHGFASKPFSPFFVKATRGTTSVASP